MYGRTACVRAYGYCQFEAWRCIPPRLGTGGHPDQSTVAEADAGGGCVTEALILRERPVFQPSQPSSIDYGMMVAQLDIHKQLQL